MILPELTVAGLAAFTAKPEIEGDPSALAVLEQAALLVQAQAGVDDLDAADVKGRALYVNATYDLAHKLLIDRSFAEDRQRPIRSESIGNYTYVRATGADDLLEASMWLRHLRAHVGIGTVR